MSSKEVSASNSTVSANILAGGGEMGELARKLDWTTTPLGAVSGWPQSLRTAVSIVFESAFPMMLAWGPAFTQIYNDAFRPILGTSKHPALGNGTAETFAEAWHIVGPLFAQVMAGRGVGFHDMLVPLDRDGYLEECYFVYTYTPVRDESNGVGGLLVACTETTARVLAERRLSALRELASTAAQAKHEHQAWSLAQAKDAAETSNRLKDEFLATLSHELRTPLNAVLGYTQMLRGGVIGEDRVPAVLETIERNARLQRQLIEDVLDVSRIITGKFRLDVQPVDLAQVIADAIETVTPAASAKGVRLQTMGRSGGGRRAAPAAGLLESALERGQVHATGRTGADPSPARELAPGNHGQRYRGRRGAADAAAPVRSVLAGRQRAVTGARWPRPGPGDLPAPGRGTRGNDLGEQSRQGTGHDRPRRAPADGRPWRRARNARPGTAWYKMNRFRRIDG
jgi:His Kinase A (phospho-acceptor) domain